MRDAKVQATPAAKECFPRHPVSRVQGAGRVDVSAADRDVARIGEDRTTPRPAASSKPPAAANSHGEKRLDKARTPLPARVQ